MAVVMLLLLLMLLLVFQRFLKHQLLTLLSIQKSLLQVLLVKLSNVPHLLRAFGVPMTQRLQMILIPLLLVLMLPSIYKRLSYLLLLPSLKNVILLHSSIFVTAIFTQQLALRLRHSLKPTLFVSLPFFFLEFINKMANGLVIRNVPSLSLLNDTKLSLLLVYSQILPLVIILVKILDSLLITSRLTIEPTSLTQILWRSAAMMFSALSNLYTIYSLVN
mmetsp:Transcript_42/g.73  ORF Transcript_42/g.73 Transcript_42/m.73 type:complete len:219 (+) Transcript_42:1299-1955(+)